MLRYVIRGAVLGCGVSKRDGGSCFTLFLPSAHTGIFKPVRPAVFSMKEWFTICQAAGDTTLALGRIGAVEERNVLITNISEPEEQFSIDELNQEKRKKTTNQ